MSNYLGFTISFDKDTNIFHKALSYIALYSGIPQMIYTIVMYRELRKELKEMDNEVS